MKTYIFQNIYGTSYVKSINKNEEVILTSDEKEAFRIVSDDDTVKQLFYILRLKNFTIYYCDISNREWI